VEVEPALLYHRGDQHIGEGVLLEPDLHVRVSLRPIVSPVELGGDPGVVLGAVIPIVPTDDADVIGDPPVRQFPPLPERDEPSLHQLVASCLVRWKTLR
jgi:hypothetical protein